MKLAAFFRNLNLGRPPAPTRLQLEQAFARAGAAAPQCFQTNGTVAFEARSLGAGRKLVVAVADLLHRELGFEEPAFVRPLAQLAALVASDPFRGAEGASIYDFYVTFLHDDWRLPEAAPMRNRRGNVEVVAYTAREALCISRKFGASPGSPNAFIEKEFGLPATTRSWGTVTRLVTACA